MGETGDWREQVFAVLSRVLLVIGLFSLVTSLRYVLAKQDWVSIAVYLIAYLALLVVTLVNRLKFSWRIHVFTIFIFTLGSISLFQSGLVGSGRLYLFLFNICAGLFLGLPAVLISLAMSATLFGFTGWALHIGWLNWGELAGTLDVFVVTATTFLALSAAISLSINLFFRYLSKTVDREKNLVGFLRDTNRQMLVEMEDRIKSEQKVKQQYEQFLSVLNNFPEPLYVSNPDNYEVVFANQKLTDLLRKNGYQGKVIGEKCYRILQGMEEECPFCTNKFIQTTDKPYSWEFFNPLLQRHYQLTDQMIEWPGQRRMRMETAVDITERKLAENKLVYDALHDSLTGLSNRALLLQRLEHCIARSRRDPQLLFAVLFLDLDQFKLINDTYGHNFGDRLLVEVAQRLSRSLRQVDTVARLGGDEFVVMLEQVESQERAEFVAQRLVEILREPYALEQASVVITPSVGIVLGQNYSGNAEEMLRHADIAMYRAKALGRNRLAFYTAGMGEAVLQRVTLEKELRRAVENHEFVVYYQPVLRMSDGYICGFEALLRWNHPQQGVVLPADFLPVMEELGLIVPVGFWSIQTACRQVKEWQQTFKSEKAFTIHVNLSPVQIQHSDLMERLGMILHETAFSAEDLVVEITEDLAIEPRAEINDILRLLRTWGVQIHLDDFGTVYSSRGKLKTMQVDTLKIDRGFVQRMNLQRDETDIVHTILALAKGLGLHTVAEGVEQEAQLERLRELGCDFWQGYLFARPLPAQEIEQLLIQQYEKRPFTEE